MGTGKHVKITIAPGGTCTVDAMNFTGQSCHTATAEITAALGGQIDHLRDKPEARRRAQTGQPEREASR